MDEFNLKSLKLLADPNKLREQKKYIPMNRLKNAIESEFNYKLTNTTYQYIQNTIRSELIIDSTINDIINQVVLNHNP